MDQCFDPDSTNSTSCGSHIFFHIYSLVQGHAVLPQFVDASVISVCSLSIATAMTVKDFLNSAESEVRSGWTEQHSTIDLH